MQSESCTQPSDKMQSAHIKLWEFVKITSTNLCKPIHDIINYSTFTCCFEFGKCGKEEKKISISITKRVKQ